MSVRIALGGRARAAAERAVARLVEDRVASRITAQDMSVLPDAAPDSLAWTEAVAESVALIDQVRDIRHELRHAHLDRAVVPSPTGATLAAAMIARTSGLEVDSDLTRLRGAAVVVQFDHADAALDAARILHDASVAPERLVLVEGTRAAVRMPQDDLGATRLGFDGSWDAGADGALSAAALVPAGLAGADLREILDEAQSEMANLAVDDPANPGLLLGAAVAAASDGVAVVADGTHIVGFPLWAARRLADTVHGVAVDAEGGAAVTGGATLRVRLVEDAEAAEPGDDVVVSGTLGELVLLWQYAVTVAAVVLSTPSARSDDGTRSSLG